MLLSKLKNKIASIKDEGTLDKKKFDFYDNEFKDGFSNDINTSSMLTTLYDVLKDNDLNGNTKLSLVKSFDKVLSLDLLKNDSDSCIDSKLKKYIEEQIKLRDDAKMNKDFSKADSIRDELLSKGVKLEGY